MINGGDNDGNTYSIGYGICPESNMVFSTSCVCVRGASAKSLESGYRITKLRGTIWWDTAYKIVLVKAFLFACRVLSSLTTRTRFLRINQDFGGGSWNSQWCAIAIVLTFGVSITYSRFKVTPWFRLQCTSMFGCIVLQLCMRLLGMFYVK